MDGAAYWDAALADFGEDEDEDEGEDELGGEDEWEDGGGGGGEEEDVEVEGEWGGGGCDTGVCWCLCGGGEGGLLIPYSMLHDAGDFLAVVGSSSCCKEHVLVPGAPPALLHSLDTAQRQSCLTFWCLSASRPQPINPPTHTNTQRSSACCVSLLLG